VVIEQVMALQPQEAVGQAPPARADDLGHHDAAIVVGDPPRHPAEEVEGPDVPLSSAPGFR
jgi:hypothetical protein